MKNAAFPTAAELAHVTSTLFRPLVALALASLLVLGGCSLEKQGEAVTSDSATAFRTSLHDAGAAVGALAGSASSLIPVVGPIAAPVVTPIATSAGGSGGDYVANVLLGLGALLGIGVGGSKIATAAKASGAHQSNDDAQDDRLDALESAVFPTPTAAGAASA